MAQLRPALSLRHVRFAATAAGGSMTTMQARSDHQSEDSSMALRAATERPSGKFRLWDSRRLPLFSDASSAATPVHLGKAGGTVTAGEPSLPLSAGYIPTLPHRDASGPAVTNPRIRA